MTGTRPLKSAIRALVVLMIALSFGGPVQAQQDCSFKQTSEVTQCRQLCPSISGPGGMSLAECFSGCAQLGKNCESWPSNAKDITIPYEVFQGELGFVLGGSRIQISNLGHGQPKDIEETRLICTTSQTPAVIQCQQECPSLVRPGGLRRSECLSGCAQLGKTCNTITREFPEFSYIWWTDVLRNFSGVDPTTNQPLLKNKFLYVPIYQRDEFFFTITCFVDEIAFPLGLATVSVSSTPFRSVNLVFAGTSSRPAVHCEGAPDVNMDSPKITLFMAPSVENGQLILTPTGAFDANVDVTGPFGGLLDWIFSIGDRIIGRSDTRLNDALVNGNLQRTLTRVAVKEIIRPYIREHAGQEVSRFLAAVVAPDGLRLWYAPTSPNLPPNNPPTN